MAASLEAVVSRLEAVAERLERLEASGVPPAGAGPAAAGARSGPCPAAGPAAGSSALSAYDALLSTAVSKVVQHAQAVGGEVLQASQIISAAFDKQRVVLAIAEHAKQPGVGDLQVLLQPVANEMMAAGQLADDRRSSAFQQFKVVAESMNGLSWLAYTGPSCGMPAPAQHVADSWQSAEFYANKLMMALKGKDEVQMAWLKSLKELNQALQQFVRQHYPQGLKWNPSGGSIAEAQKKAAAGGTSSSSSATASAAAAPRGPPAPPPAPSAEMLLRERPGAVAERTSNSGGGLKDVFSELQKAGGVTVGLRKVTDDMKAKNRTDRSGHVPATTAAPTAAVAHAAAAPSAAGVKAGPRMGTPRSELEQDRKWVVEHHSGDREIIIERTDPKHTVYIYNCHNSVIQVRGKVNAVSIDGCKKTGVVFEHVIATCELVNCSSMQVQCLGHLPTMSIDKCDGCQVFVSSEVAAGDFQLVTAKSSEVNVNVVPSDPNSNADAVEHAVPEQFISSFKDGKLITVAASHSGG